MVEARGSEGAKLRSIAIPTALAIEVDAYAQRYGITSEQAVIHALGTMLAEEPPQALRPSQREDAA